MGDRSSVRHPLLDELRGVLHRLKCTPQPVKDGHDHLVPFCETLEGVLRNGLKQPNSWFGLNKQDYWSWIEPLQDYYFNVKQNPLLRHAVALVAASPKLCTVQGKGRCFIRIALCQKLVSVPVEHLAKNKRLTNYWYREDSIIGNTTLRECLMSILFEVTEVDFELDVEDSSFLDETWIIPVYVSLRLPPIKTLDLTIGYVAGRGLVVSLEKECLAEQAGVEVGDLLDEVCGEPVFESGQGKLKHILVTKSVDATDLMIVKKHLPDGSPFYPILRRQLTLDNISQGGPSSPTSPPAILHRKPSLIVQIHGECTEYTIVYLGKEEDIKEEPSEEVIDSAISRVLNSMRKPQEVIVRVSQTEVSLLVPPTKEALVEFHYDSLCGCGRGAIHQTCLALMGAVGGSLTAHILEAPSAELAQTVCAHIAQGFNRTIWFRDKES